MNKSRDEDDGDECFYESQSRILSSASSSTSTSDDDNASPTYRQSHRRHHRSSAAHKFAGAISKYDIWTSQPSSVEERRHRLLREMGLSADPSFSRRKPPTVSSGGEFAGSVSQVQLTSYLNSGGSNCDGGEGSVRLKLDGAESNCSSSLFSSIHPVMETSVNNNIHPRSNGKLPKSKNCKRIHYISNGSTNSKPSLNLSGNFSLVAANADGVRGEGQIEGDSFFNGIGGVEDRVRTIKNLDNGKEFVVKGLREDGSWDKVKEIGTGRQLTMEEFEKSVGHSPIVQELMRRQCAGEGNKDDLDLDSNIGHGSKLKKKGGWLKSIRNVASSVAGYKEIWSSDERDTSSDKGGRRSSSATDDSQDLSLHGPERIRVRQFGKSSKDLSALYRSQEMQAHNGSIWSMKFSLDGRYLASAGEDCVVHVWKVGESERRGELLMEKLDDGNLNLLLAAADGSLELSSMSPSLDGHGETKRRGRPSLGRKSLSSDHVVVPETVFALSEKPLSSFRGHLADVLDLSWSKSQHLLSSSMDSTVRLWHLTSDSCLKVFSHSAYVTCIQFNPIDDRYFISGSLDAKFRIWSIPDRQVVDWNDTHEEISAACFTPDGQGALVGSSKGSCRLYNTSENKLQLKCQIKLQSKKKKCHQKKITGFQFVPGSSSEVLVTSADSRVRVIDGTDLVHKFKGFRNTNSQISASLTSNGKYVVCASEDSYVYLWKYNGEYRPSRTKGLTVSRSYEHFHCQDVLVAVPWPGLDDTLDLKPPCSRDHPPTPADEIYGGESFYCPLYDTISSASNNYFFDRISATWPEEKLVLPAKNGSCVDFSNGVAQNRSAWGMVIVTAGIRGEIKVFQNFGLPFWI